MLGPALPSRGHASLLTILAVGCPRGLIPFVIRVNAGTTRINRGVPMSQYLLSTYAVEGGAASRAPGPPGEMAAFLERVVALEADMEACGTLVFGRTVHGPGGETAAPRDGGVRV